MDNLLEPGPLISTGPVSREGHRRGRSHRRVLPEGDRVLVGRIGVGGVHGGGRLPGRIVAGEVGDREVARLGRVIRFAKRETKTVAAPAMIPRIILSPATVPDQLPCIGTGGPAGPCLFQTRGIVQTVNPSPVCPGAVGRTKVWKKADGPS